MIQLLRVLALAIVVLLTVEVGGLLALVTRTLIDRAVGATLFGM